MIQKYSFLHLLDDISKGIQPDKVSFRGTIYTWNPAEKNYRSADGESLMDHLTHFSGADLCSRPVIMAEKEILTEAEHEFLQTVLAPIRERILSITKRKSGPCGYLEIDFMEIPEFGEATHGRLESWAFKIVEDLVGMRLNYHSTPEELGI